MRVLHHEDSQLPREDLTRGHDRIAESQLVEEVPHRRQALLGVREGVVEEGHVLVVQEPADVLRYLEDVVRARLAAGQVKRGGLSAAKEQCRDR